VDEILIVAVPILSAFSAGQFAIAQQSEDRCLFGNYQDGYQAELAAGAADYREGRGSTLTARKEQLTIAPGLV
jgi:hypothetical protein